jgi:NADPH-dependent 2,4-dienoyl-CoA reductase/sulfur reductase-like enzyme
MNPVLEAARADGVLILGGGQAGANAAQALRAAKFDGAVRIIGNEAELPYERPSLSKEMLLLPERETIVRVLPESRYAEREITLTLGTSAVALDRERRRVVLADGSKHGYGAVIFATGSRPRQLEVPGAETCLYLRSLADSRRLRDRLGRDVRLLVIGAGFIGLEVAASAIKLGAKVTVADAAPQVLGRIAPPILAEFYQSYHRAQGVDLRLGVQLARIAQRNGAQVAEFSDGSAVAADIILVGIGVIPNAELAAKSGLAVERGIVVDAFGATADPHVLAAGDVAQAWHPTLGRYVLLESWQNAQNQAIAVARNLVGEHRVAHADVPWFWSDQFDLNLQIAGLTTPGCRFVRRGPADARSWMLFAMEQDRIVAAMAINAPRELRAARELIALGAPVADHLLAAADTNLAALVRNAKSEKTQQSRQLIS